MAWLVVKVKYQKDTCYDEIRICAPNWVYTPFYVQYLMKVGEPIQSLKEEEILHLDFS